MMSLLIAGFSTSTLLAEEEAQVRYSALPDSCPSSASSCRDLNNDWPSPFTNSVCWSDGLEPHRGPEYIAGQIGGKNTVLWTPIMSAETAYDCFKTLTIEDGCTLCIRHKSQKAAIFEDLRLKSGAAIWGPNVEATILKGKLHVEKGSELTTIRTYNNKTITIASDLYGDGELRFASQSGTSACKGNYRLYGDNSNFTGTLYVTTSADSPTFTEGYSTLFITNSVNLGGRLPEFVYNALTLAMMSSLSVSEKNIVIPAELNRGIYIYGKGRIRVPADSETFTANTSITMRNNARLYKEGDGRLILGAPLNFLNKNGTFVGATAGTDCNYYIDVREGSLSLTDSRAMNGACISFSNNTELVVFVNPTDDGLKKYGVRGEKTRYSTSFITDVPIRLCVSGDEQLTKNTYRIPLVTVKEAYADDVAGKLKVTLDIKRYKLMGISMAAADGISNAITFYAVIDKDNGFVLSIK